MRGHGTGGADTVYIYDPTKKGFKKICIGAVIRSDAMSEMRII